MMEKLVMSALQWMHIGLPLQCLKVVLYARAEGDSEVENCKQIFEKLRDDMKSIEASLMNPSPQTDIFIIYAKDDKELKERVCELFKRIKKGFKITSLYEIARAEDSWQHDLNQKMVTSKRVVPLLTEGFLSSEICIDAYNVALCANRLCHRPLLAPLCMDQCYIPQYMAMVQWINCKQRDMLKIERAIGYLDEDIQTDGQSNTDSYDVFLSYSHRNLPEAKQFLTTLQEADHNLKIFFDYDELKMGVSWQQKLYNSISGVPCVLALVTPDYMASAVCQEEFSLALAQHLAKKRTTELVPVMIKQTEDFTFSPHLLPHQAYEGNMKKHVENVCHDILKWTRDNDKSDIFSPITDSVDFHDAMERHRFQNFHKFYIMSEGNLKFKDNPTTPKPPLKVTLHLSFVPSDQHYVTFFEKLLAWKHPKSSFTFLSRTVGNLQENSEYLTSIVFLSEDFVKSTREMEELDVLLGKLRTTKDVSRLYVVVVGRLPSNPLYVHLIPTQTSLLDEFWESNLQHAQSGTEYERCNELNEHITQNGHTSLRSAEMLGLRKVVFDIDRIVSDQSLPDTPGNGEAIINVLKLHWENQGISPTQAKKEVGERSTKKHDHGSFDSSKIVMKRNPRGSEACMII